MRILGHIEDSNLTLKEAVGGYAKVVAYKMREVGKRITENGVKKWFKVDDTPRTNWLKQAFQGLHGLTVNPAGFELVATTIEVFIREERRELNRQIETRGSYALVNPIPTEVERAWVIANQKLNFIGEFLCGTAHLEK